MRSAVAGRLADDHGIDGNGTGGTDSSLGGAWPEEGGADSAAGNMAERISGRDEQCRSAECSIQRTKRQSGDEDEMERQEAEMERQEDDELLEPYVPYLGFIFYSFPVFSFTLPFGGQLKLFGYDFI